MPDQHKDRLAHIPWLIAAAYAAVSFAAKPGWGLTVFGDGMQFMLMVAISAAFARHIRHASGRARWFWALMTSGTVLWLTSQVMWSYYELWRGQPAPTPYVGDVVLFLHLVPMMAGLATIPHERSRLPRLIAVSLAMVAVWWVFLYAFLVIPWQYVHPHAAGYDPAFNALYAIENLTVIGFLALLAVRASGAWRRLYVLLLVGSMVYAVNSQWINRFIQQKSYYTGSPYDLLFILPVAWMASAVASFKPEIQQPTVEEESLGSKSMAWAAIAGLISVPVLMGWNIWWPVENTVRDFRFLVGVIASVLLAAMLFAQQHILSEERLKSLMAAKQSLMELAKAREELEYRATHDAMTGCLNCATVLVALDRELARAKRQNSTLAVLLVDLDEFKRINDTLGHHAGDLAISYASAAMRECVRDHDYVGRYGGEEFLLVIPDCSPEIAMEVAERVRQRVAQEPCPTFNGKPLKVTATIGLALSKSNEESGELLRRTDLALYAGKDRGRNRIEFADGWAGWPQPISLSRA
jgi:diguanylate cyclase (GGDEF)-like protein